MFCKNCGKEVQEGQLFCGNCGTKVDGVKADTSNNSGSNNIGNSTTSNNTNTDKKKLKNNNWIQTVIVILVLGVVIGLNSSDSPKSQSDEPLANLSTWNVPELEPVKVNEDAILPEATEEYTKGNLELKLPKNYSKNTTASTNDVDCFCTEIANDEQFVVSIGASEYPDGIEYFINNIEESFWDIEGTNKVRNEDIKTEYLNGVKWYVKTVQYDAIDGSKEDVFAEYYYAQSNNVIYSVTFIYGTFNDKEINTSRTTQFYNVKQSLKLK